MINEGSETDLWCTPLCPSLDMRKKRVRSRVIFIFLGLLGYGTIWRISQKTSSSHLQKISSSDVNTRNWTAFTNPLQLLPGNDYNQLINLKFSFTMLNFACNEYSPLLLVLVHSSPKNFVKRRTIRETWGQHYDDNVKVLFMIGAVESSYLQTVLEKENALHNDLIQGTFLDTYRNLTYKHVMVLKYAVYHCAKAKYVLKTDDDVFVNIPGMRKFLTVELYPYEGRRMLFCTPRHQVAVSRTEDKWRVSFEEYPNNTYPTYCPGWTVLYTSNIILDMYKEAQMAEFFWIDDIHITGTMIEKIHLTHTDIEPLVISDEDLKDVIEGTRHVSNPFLYGRANMNEKQIRTLWKYVTNHPLPSSFINKIHIL